jgi:anti-sigma factor RsiW
MTEHVTDELAAYAEDQLEPARRRQVETHLQGCDVCRAELARIRQGITLASHLERDTMPADVDARIRQAIAEARVPATSPRAARGIRWWQSAAAAVLVLGAVGLYWHVNRPWVQLHAASDSATTFERDGRALHDRLRAGTAQLSFTSADEQALWHWLASQGAPVTSMRAERPVAERAQFVAIGATVQALGAAKASVLEYRIDGRAVTLALAESKAVPDAPAAGWWTKRVMHRRDATGINTLTWTVGGGTYVMVSELDGSGQRACLICHVTSSFRQRLQGLSSP